MSRRVPIILLILIAMAVITTWPLVARLDRGIPRGVESSSTVPIFNLWTVGWNLDSALSGWRQVWDAPHFHPTEKTLALSEPLLASQVMVGLAWLPPSVAYNLFLLSALVLNAGITWLALSRRNMRWPVALLASLAMARLPFVHSQIGMLQGVLLAGIIGTVHFADEALSTGRLRSFLLAAACFDLTFLTSGYYALFIALLLPIWGGVMLWQRWGRAFQRRRELIWGVLGAALILAAIIPIVVIQSRALSDPFFERPRELIQELSALPTDYLEAPFPELFGFVGLSRWHDPTRWKLSPGLWKCGLAVIGLVVGVRQRRRRGWTLTWLALTLGACVGSLGLNLQIGGWSPYATLLDWSATLARLRTPARMAVLVQMGVVFLAAEALHWGFRRARIVARSKTGFRGCVAFGLFWIVGLTACWEVSLPKLSFVEVPSVASQRDWIEWLSRHTREDAVIAHVPFPRGPLAGDYEGEAWAMYWGLFHHRRMVNGYSGFFPASYLELKSQMQSFPDEPSFAALRSRGVSYCVVRQSFVDKQRLLEHPVVIEQWELVFQDNAAEVAIFRLR